MRFDHMTGVPSDQDEAMAQIAWFEGLQLLPQHFQTWDARVEGLLLRQMLAASPHAWGLDRLELDERALSAGKVRLLSAAGCFPDGLVFSWSGQRDGVLECALDGGAEPVRYALVVPKEDFSENGTSIARFRQCIGAPLADRNNRDEKASIVRWQPNLAIRRWDALDPRYVQIPFLEVANTPAGFVAADFHPPAARLGRDSACAREIAALIRRLRVKAAQLGAPSVPPALNAEFRCGLGWILSSLVSGLPRLEAQMAGESHPSEISLSLCAIADMVAPLVGKAPDHFPPYDHSDPQVSILALVRFIRGIADGIGVDRRHWRETPFTFADGDWSVAIPAAGAQQELLVQVSFDPGAQESAVAFWLRHTLICPADEKDRSRGARVRGLARRSDTTLPELGLDAAAGRRYVRVRLEGGGGAFAGRQLVIAGPDAHSGLVLARISLLEPAAG